MYLYRSMLWIRLIKGGQAKINNRITSFTLYNQLTVSHQRIHEVIYSWEQLRESIFRF